EFACDQCCCTRRQIHDRGESRGIVCPTWASCPTGRCRLAASVAPSDLRECPRSRVNGRASAWDRVAQGLARGADGQSQNPFRWCLPFESYGIVKHGTAEAPYRALEDMFRSGDCRLPCRLINP